MKSLRFKFGQNWREYNSSIGADRIEAAQIGILKLLNPIEISDKKIVDIGSGSGLHALSFLKLGAKEVTCIDIDTDSIAATKETLNKFANKFENWTAFEADILNPDALNPKSFEIVYSWGVLHHTGNMKLAVKNASQLCKVDGLFVFALYRKTFLCNFWKIEKWFYIRSPLVVKKLLEYVYIFLFLFGKILKRDDVVRFIRSYETQRGMKFNTDVKDWLGGYPYESILPINVEELLIELGFEKVRDFVQPKSIGLFGSGCDEYVFRRIK